MCSDLALVLPEVVGYRANGLAVYEQEVVSEPGAQRKLLDSDACPRAKVKFIPALDAPTGSGKRLVNSSAGLFFGSFHIAPIVAQEPTFTNSRADQPSLIKMRSLGYTQLMSSLIESNPYLRDPQELDRIIADRVRDSCTFEGARGLPRRKISQRTSPPGRQRRPCSVTSKTEPAGDA
jgi:hypothetical protein